MNLKFIHLQKELKLLAESGDEEIKEYVMEQFSRGKI